MAEMCACGEPLHYNDPRVKVQVETLIVTKGECIPVRTVKGAWLVPRHYIALHGINAAELPTIARVLGFKRAPG